MAFEVRDEVAAIRRVVFALGILQLILHLGATFVARDPRVILPHAVAWLHDLAVLATLLLVVNGLFRVCPAWARPAVRAGAFGAVFAAGVFLAVYPQMLQTFLAAPFNFLQTDRDTATVFLREYSGIGVLWPVAPVLAIVLLTPRVKKLRPPKLRPVFVFGAAIVIGAALLRESPNPIVFGIQDSIRELFVPRTVPRLKTMSGEARNLVRPAGASLNVSESTHLRYDRLLLIVLESVTAADFESGLLRRPSGFFERNRDRACFFSRYYATNLDSYTSLIAMTTAIQVPFRAYAAPERYERVNDEPNLARSLRAAGFRTLFISTYEHQPFVPNSRDWDQVSDRRDLGSLTGWVSLGAQRMESATEDRAAIPAIVKFLESSPRAFVLAELVFGHSPEWRARTGMTPAEYYDRYLTDLWKRLDSVGPTSRTLLMVVSDHGDRSTPAQPDNYRVPLLAVAEGIDPGVDSLLRSHLDLWAIAAHFLQGTPMPEPRHEVTLVGSTECWVYGTIRDDSESLFIDDNTGRVLYGALDPSDLYAGFQAYVASFASAFIRR